MKFLSLAALEIVILANSCAACDENYTLFSIYLMRSYKKNEKTTYYPSGIYADDEGEGKTHFKSKEFYILVRLQNWF